MDDSVYPGVTVTLPEVRARRARDEPPRGKNQDGPSGERGHSCGCGGQRGFHRLSDSGSNVSGEAAIKHLPSSAVPPV